MYTYITVNKLNLHVYQLYNNLYNNHKIIINGSCVCVHYSCLSFTIITAKITTFFDREFTYK